MLDFTWSFFFLIVLISEAIRSLNWYETGLLIVSENRGGLSIVIKNWGLQWEKKRRKQSRWLNATAFSYLLPSVNEGNNFHSSLCFFSLIQPPQHSFLPKCSDTTWSRTGRWKRGEQLAKMAKDVPRHSHKVPVLGYVCSKSYNVNEIHRTVFTVTEVFLEFSAKVYSPHHYFENPLKNRTKHFTWELVPSPMGHSQGATLLSSKRAARLEILHPPPHCKGRTASLGEVT